MKNKIYIAVTGIPDCGKSTFIKNIIEETTKRNCNVDSFCDEQILNKTIRSSQLFLHDINNDYDIVLLDCPGHYDEYPEEIISCISKCHFLLYILDDNRFLDSMLYLNRVIKPILSNFNKDYMHITSHSLCKADNCYDTQRDDFKDKLSKIYLDINKYIKENNFIPVDPYETAKRIADKFISKNKKTAVCCSYGKDSIVLLNVLKDINVLDKVDILYPFSGYDLPDLNEKFIEEVDNFFNIKHKKFNVFKKNWNFKTKTTHELMLCKAEMLTNYLNKHNYFGCMTGIRRDEEGTRAKEKFYSPRNKDGSFNNLVSQFEIFGNELNDELMSSEQLRINPLLDMTELDIWKTIKLYNLPVCNAYFAKQFFLNSDIEKRYRSLGDWPITTPIESYAKNIDDIIEELEKTVIPERACRELQDKSIEYGMENLRKKGFF